MVPPQALPEGQMKGDPAETKRAEGSYFPLFDLKIPSPASSLPLPHRRGNWARLRRRPGRPRSRGGRM